MIYLLLEILVMILVVFLLLCKGDWFNPAVFVPIAFLFSVVCATCNVDLWGINLSTKTFAIIAGGVTLFSIISFSQNRKRVSKLSETIARINLSRWQLTALLIFFCMVTLLYYANVTSSFSALGVSGSGWNEAMYERRVASADVELSSYTNMPTYVVYAYNTMQALSFVILYIVINNVFAERGLVRQDIPLAICLAIYLVSVILKGGRLPILEIAFGAACIIWILWHKKHGWRGVIKLTYIVAVVFITVGILIVFSALRDVVGRQSDSDVLSYITSYAGGSIQLFDMYLSDPAFPNTYFGQETFRGIWSALIRHVDVGQAFSWQLEFRYSNGVSLGNVYTAFRYWIHDFGYFGALIILIFYAMFYSRFYDYVSRSGIEKPSYGITMYAFLFSGLAMLPIQDVLLAMRLNPGNIYMMLCILFFDWYLIERQKKKRGSGGNRTVIESIRSDALWAR